MVDARNTLSELDQVVSRLRRMNSDSITLSQDDVWWLLAEIDGGREAFSALIQQKKVLSHQVVQLQRTIDDLLAMRRPQ